jgi:hypothetical protein
MKNKDFKQLGFFNMISSTLFLDITIFVLKQSIKTIRNKWPYSIHGFIFWIRTICCCGSWRLRIWRRRCWCFVHVRFECVLNGNRTYPFFRNDAFNKWNKCWHIGQSVDPRWYVLSTDRFWEFTWKTIAIFVY